MTHVIQQNFNLPALERIKEEPLDEVSPWKLFKLSEIALSIQIVKKISSTLTRFSSIDLNTTPDSDKNVLLILSDNSVPKEWRKLWQGPKLASEFLKAVAIRVQTISKFLDQLDEPIQEIDFSKIFNVDSFLSTIKLVASRKLRVSTTELLLETFADQSRAERVTSDKDVVVTIAPLLIDGLGFDKNRLVRPNGSSSRNFTSSLFIYFKSNVNTSPGDEETGNFAVPVYATNSREKLLCTINISTSLDKNEIILSGTSLIVPEN